TDRPLRDGGERRCAGAELTSDEPTAASAADRQCREREQRARGAHPKRRLRGQLDGAIRGPQRQGDDEADDRGQGRRRPAAVPQYPGHSPRVSRGEHALERLLEAVREEEETRGNDPEAARVRRWGTRGAGP